MNAKAENVDIEVELEGYENVVVIFDVTAKPTRSSFHYPGDAGEWEVHEVTGIDIDDEENDWEDKSIMGQLSKEQMDKIDEQIATWMTEEEY
jgi:hypothetical protein